MQVASALIDAIYAAPLGGDAGWSTALHAIQTRFNASGALIEVGDQRDGLLFLQATNLDGMQEYLEYYRGVCPRFELQLASSVGDVTHDGMLGDEAALDRSEFYVDFLSKQNLRYHAAGTISTTATGLGLIAIQRSPSAGRVSADDLAAFARLLPHVRRAVAMTRALGDAQSEARDLRAALAVHRDAVMLLAHDGRVTYANPVADALLRRSAELVTAGGRLSARSESARRRLTRFLKTALASPDGGETSINLGSAIGTATHVTASRLPRPAVLDRFRDPPSGAQLLVTIRTALGRHSTPNHLHQFAGLTMAEARVASALLNGETLREYAVRSGLTLNTVRTYMRQIRERLQCRSQSEVVAKLVQLVG